MNILCRLLGHKPVESELKRSPNTSFTHWRDIDCARCGARLDFKKEWRDARTEPELFRHQPTKD